jgi:hypothetical protein
LVAQTATFDIATAGFTAIIGATAAINYALAGHPWLSASVGIATVAVLVLTIAKNAVVLAQAKHKESLDELEGCLLTLHASLDPAALHAPGRLRLAVHVAVEQELEQVTEYIGGTPRKERAGRRFPANAGIIGIALREGAEGDAFVGQRVNDDYRTYVEELVRDWNYTRERAEQLNPAVMSWMAVPFNDPDTSAVEAVLYLDSTEREFFTPERQELVMAAATGMAVFIGRRYSS